MAGGPCRNPPGTHTPTPSHGISGGDRARGPRPNSSLGPIIRANRPDSGAHKAVAMAGVAVMLGTPTRFPAWRPYSRRTIFRAVRKPLPRKAPVDSENDPRFHPAALFRKRRAPAIRAPATWMWTPHRLTMAVGALDVSRRSSRGLRKRSHQNLRRSNRQARLHRVRWNPSAPMAHVAIRSESDCPRVNLISASSTRGNCGAATRTGFSSASGTWRPGTGMKSTPPGWENSNAERR